MANLATLETTVSHPHNCTICKAFPMDLHQVTNVATGRDIVEACFMQRAPLLGGRLCGGARRTAGPNFSPRELQHLAGLWLGLEKEHSSSTHS
jgi:hypothetical protein